MRWGEMRVVASEWISKEKEASDLQKVVKVASNASRQAGKQQHK